MKIELDLPQVPDGWRCLGFKMPKKGQGYCGPNGVFSISEIDHSFYRYVTFERIEPVDHELEEAKLKFTVGSMVQYRDEESSKQPRAIKEVFRCVDYGVCVRYASGGFNPVYRLEIYVEDTELEEAKKLIGTWVTDTFTPNRIFKITDAYRGWEECAGEVQLMSGCDVLSFSSCTPFPIPRWRCCESDKPKKIGANYILRSKFNGDKLFCYFFVNSWETSSLTSPSDYEWLDEGEL